MKLSKVLEITKELIENDNIPKEGLSITYKMDKNEHEKLDRELFYSTNNNYSDFKHNDTIELNLGGITFIFLM
jgi:hypothetical protein